MHEPANRTEWLLNNSIYEIKQRCRVAKYSETCGVSQILTKLMPSLGIIRLIMSRRYQPNENRLDLACVSAGYLGIDLGIFFTAITDQNKTALRKTIEQI